MTEIPRKTSLGGLVSSISSRLSGRPSRQAYEEHRDDQEEGAPANALPMGKAVSEGFTSAISRGGLTARHSRKAEEDTLGKSSPYPARPTPVEEDAQVRQSPTMSGNVVITRQSNNRKAARHTISADHIKSMSSRQAAKVQR